MNENELRALRKKLREELRALIEAGKSTDLSDEQEKRIAALDVEIDGIDVKLDKIATRAALIAKHEAKDAEPATVAERATPPGQTEEDRGAVISVGANRAEDRPFRSFGEFLRCVAAVEGPAHFVDDRLRPLEVRAGTGLQEGVPSDGGFLVQQDFSSEILKRSYEVGQILSRVRKIPVSANSTGIALNAVDETSRATGSRMGGVRGYWAAEGGDKTASKALFRQIKLELHKLIGLCYATDELLADVAALESIIRNDFAEEISFLVEDAIWEGTGAGMPVGIVGHASVVTVAAEAGQAAATIVFNNIVNMWSRMWARSRLNAVWLINQDVEPELYNLGITVGTGGTPAYLPPGGLSGSPYGTLFGRPVIAVEYCSTLGTTGDIALVDLSQYVMIDKGGLQTASSIHVRFTNDEQVFRFVYRVDGQPIWKSALTPFKGTNTVSPFVLLATR